MQHETAVSLKADACRTSPRSLPRVRIASAPTSFVLLLLLSEATQQADAAASSCSVLFQSFRDVYKPRLAFQHAVIPLGKTSGPRREDAIHRERYNCPWAVCGSKDSAARRRVAPWILEDSGRQEDVFGMRAVGEVGNLEGDNNSSSSSSTAGTSSNNSSTRNGDIVDDRGDVGGAVVEGKVAVAEGLGVTEDTSATSSPGAREGTAVASGSEEETEVASFEFAPAMTVHKFKTLQNRRVPVVFKYSGGGGFKRYFEEIATVLKKHFPDVLIDREIVEVSSTREEELFEIRVDGKLVCTKKRGKPGVFLHMETFEQAIRKARQRRRPGAVVYGDAETFRNVKALGDDRETGLLSIE